MPISQTEEALVFAAKNGNIKCFEELYKRYYDKIYALAMTILKNSADAEDVLQMTFIKAWQGLERLKNISAFNTWLQRITINQCNSLYRSNKPGYSLDDEGENGELLQIESDLMLPEEYAERGDLANRLKAIIDGLSVVQRETILLYYYSEMSIEEIAQTMDCSEGTVKSRLFLARKAIRTEIDEQEKKTGERFYGVPFVPFAGVFVRQVRKNSVSPQTAANIYEHISSAVFPSPVASSVVPQSVSSAKGAAVTASSGAHIAAKSTFPLWAKIVSGTIAAGLLTGGRRARVEQSEKQA